jgi:tetratricopeptide (TPR) repeat protein
MPSTKSWAAGGGLALPSLGWVALMQGDYAEAERSFAEEVRTMRELGNQRRISLALVTLGFVACYQGKLEEARSLFTESLKLGIQRGLQREIAPVLEGFARVAGAQAQAERAARLFGAAAALREATSTPLLRSRRADHEQQVAAVHADLGEEAFAAAWAEGRALTLEHAVAFALADDVQPPPGAEPPMGRIP